MPTDSVGRLWLAEQQLEGEIARSATQTNAEQFYAAIRPALDQLCEAIGEHIGCDSVAVFFVDESSGASLRMRGAYGNLRWVLDGEGPAGIVYSRPEGSGVSRTSSSSCTIRRRCSRSTCPDGGWTAWR